MECAFSSPIIIAGMHRSGTSFVASFVRNAGIDMGARLVEPSRGNELGHFENADFVQFHMRQLALLGYADAGWIANDEMTLGEEAFIEATRIVAENARSGPWGWKDPRATLFLKFWLRVVPSAHFVLLYREPAEVIESLFRRGDQAIKLCPETAARAWLSHNSNLLAFARAHRDRCLVANIERVVDEPRAFLSVLSSRFHVDIDVETPTTFQPSFLHVDVRHSPLPTLLRHFVPETGGIYGELEAEADLPGLPSSRSAANACSVNAKEAFFAHWMTAADTALVEALALEREALASERERNRKLLEHIWQLESTTIGNSPDRAGATTGNPA